MAQDVKDIRANANENIMHAANIIGRSKHRRKVFEAIYKGKSQVKSVRDLAKVTKLSEKRVLEEGKKLVSNEIVEQQKINGRTAYKKDKFYTTHKRKILSLLDNPERKKNFPTKQEPRASGGRIIKIHLNKGVRPRYRYIAVDEIDSFQKIKSIIEPKQFTFKTLSESKIKAAFQSILKQEGEFKDWGGETNDLFTGKLRYKKKRRLAAFAFKGKATKGLLKPSMMGKNGDQIARLFGSPAQFFIIVYPRQIDQSIIKQMEVHSLATAMSGKPTYYCTIGGSDFFRIYQAYKQHFK